MTAPRPVAVQMHTPEDVAARLRISKRSVYDLIATGELRAADMRVNGTRPRTRIRDDDLAAFIDKRTRPPLRAVRSA